MDKIRDYFNAYAFGEVFDLMCRFYGTSFIRYFNNRYDITDDFDSFLSYQTESDPRKLFPFFRNNRYSDIRKGHSVGKDMFISLKDKMDDKVNLLLMHALFLFIVIITICGIGMMIYIPIEFGIWLALGLIGIMLSNPTLLVALVIILIINIIMPLWFFAIYFYIDILRSPSWDMVNMLRGHNGTNGTENALSTCLNLMIAFYVGSADRFPSAALSVDNFLSKVQYAIYQYGTRRYLLKLMVVGFLGCTYYTCLLLLRSSYRVVRTLLWLSYTTLICIIFLKFTSKIEMLVICVLLDFYYFGIVSITKLAKGAYYSILLWYYVVTGRKKNLSASSNDEVFVEMDSLEYVLKNLRNKVFLKTLQVLKEADVFLVTYGIPYRKVTFRSLFVESSMGLTRVLNQFDPPGFIRRMGDLPSDIPGTIQILRDIGYPVDPDIEFTPLRENPIDPKMSPFTIGQTGVGTGIRRLRIWREEEISLVKDLVVEYKYSDEYVTLQNELESIARYFTPTNVQLSKDTMEKGVDATWDMLKLVFQNSRIVPLYHIWSNWNKKFNLGSLATESLTSRKTGEKYTRKIRRKDYIRHLGGVKGVMKQWKELYSKFPLMTNIANIFPKSEALPPKKWSKDKIRTPISSGLPQYLFQQVFSYEPNHRYMVLDTPIKVGMPINGTWMVKVFEQHSSRKYHYAGDMTDFDSTIRDQVITAVKEVRKKGYQHHKMYQTICDMIDLSYDSIENAVMWTSSNGILYRKAGGLMTGHASTSSDNSVATVFFYMCAWVELTGKSASEFKHFNTLSCYGDDHLFSHSENAPKAWTFGNIQKIMAKWGVTLKDEVPEVIRTKLNGEVLSKRIRNPTELEPLPFLSKFGRVPTVADRKEWTSIFGSKPVPKFIIYHDRNRLIGKAAAGSKSLNAFDRIERLTGYMYLCAHSRDLYDMLNEMVDTIIETNTGRRRGGRGKIEGLEKMRKKIPSYARVMEIFYDPNSNVSEPDQILDEDDVQVYGDMQLLDYVANYLSYIPDVLNPDVLQFGFGILSQKTIASRMTWPAELLTMSNKIVNPGHLHKALDESPYRFIVNREIPTVKTNPLTLLVRHWLFMGLYSKKYDWSPFALIDGIAMKVANAYFIFNGRVPSKVVSYSTPVWQILTILLLNFVTLPEVAFVVKEKTYYLSDLILDMPYVDVSLLALRAWNYGLAKIWSSVPPNFRELRHLERKIPSGEVHAIVAATGTGKSTSLISHLANTTGNHFNKIIVVEPRSKVVKGLTSYMKGEGLNCSGATSGLVLDQRAKVWYVTAQEVILHAEWLNPDNLLIMDEAHIEEETYTFIPEMNMGRGENHQSPMILMSATPAEYWKELTSYTVIPLPKVFTVESKNFPEQGAGEVTLDKTKLNYWFTYYINAVRTIMDVNKTPFSKFVIFVNDKREVEEMLKLIPGHGIGLTSESEEDFEFKCDYVVTTAVADVAITIPGATVVITPDFTRFIDSSKGVTKTPTYIKLDESTIVQRKGRTGRTNNGKFYIVNMRFKEDAVIERTVKSNISQFIDWIVQGLPPLLLAEIRPEIFEFGELDYSGEDAAKTIMKNFANIYEAAKLRTGDKYRRNLDDMSRDYADTATYMYGMSGESSGYHFDLQNIHQEVLQALQRAIGWEHGIIDEEIFFRLYNPEGLAPPKQVDPEGDPFA